MGERIRKVKVRKVVGWDKERLMSKAKAMPTSRGEQGAVFHHVP